MVMLLRKGIGNIADLNEVMSWVRELCVLSPTPSDGQKVCSLKIVRAMDMQSSYLLPVGETSLNILKEIDGKVSFPQSGKISKKLSKFLSCPTVQSCKCHPLSLWWQLRRLCNSLAFVVLV